MIRRSDLLVIADDEMSAVESILAVKSPRTPPPGELLEAIGALLNDVGYDPRRVDHTGS